LTCRDWRYGVHYVVAFRTAGPLLSQCLSQLITENILQHACKVKGTPWCNKFSCFQSIPKYHCPWNFHWIFKIL